MTTSLTPLQLDVLGIVDECGPISVSDLTYHLPIANSSARSALNALERRGLIGRTYTGHHCHGAQFAFEIKGKGQDVLAEMDARDD